jgi:hypothetical protein
MKDFAFQVESFTVRVASFALRVEDFTVRVTSFGLWVEDFTFRVASFALSTKNFTDRVQDFIVWVESLVFRVEALRLCLEAKFAEKTKNSIGGAGAANSLCSSVLSPKFAQQIRPSPGRTK